MNIALKSTIPLPLLRFGSERSKQPSAFWQEYLAENAPSKPLLQSDHAAVILNITPARPGHALVIPKRQVTKLTDCSPQELHDMIMLVQAYQKLWMGLSPHKKAHFDFSVFVNDGKLAGQSVPHAHIHVVPIHNEKPMPKGGLRGMFRIIDKETTKPIYPDKTGLYKIFKEDQAFVDQFLSTQNSIKQFSVTG
jgi:diadenosine tetraphosphate (Ap4A) HIT family hydrolase